MELSNNYQPTKFLREGGSSSLYECENIITEQIVVAKLIPFTKKNVKQMYEAEVEILNQLKGSPNIIQIVENQTHQDYGCIILPRMKCDLLDLIEVASKFNDSAAKKIFYQVCKGVKSCHENRIAHMDIKPENILQAYSGEFFLADFGGAKRINDSNLMEQTFTGTKMYCAPEIRKSYAKLTDPLAADVWSLGIVLFSLLTGSWPFANINDLSEDTPIFLDRPEISTQAQSLLKAILQHNPNDRLSIDQILNHPWFCAQETEQSTEEKKHKSSSCIKTSSFKKRPVRSFFSFIRSLRRVR